jgi:hypothetical protein
MTTNCIVDAIWEGPACKDKKSGVWQTLSKGEMTEF